MGITSTKQKQQQPYYCIVGKQGSGKTTLCYHMKLYVPDSEHHHFNSSPFLHLTDGTAQVYKWDLIAEDPFESVWHHHFAKCTGIIFVLDSCWQIDASRQALHMIVNMKETKSKPLLILANKQDDEHAHSVDDLANKMDIGKLKHKIRLQPCCFLSGDGIDTGLKWLQGK